MNVASLSVLTDSVAALERIGLTVSPSLRGELDSMRDSKFTIAVVGTFGVGKTTLINKIFIGEDRLPIGNGLPTTIDVNEVHSGNLMILDTPGLDDPDQKHLMETTYKAISRADVILLVVGARLLDMPEITFLKDELIARGLAKIMVLASFKPNVWDMDELQRKNVNETICAQLANIGRDDIPVMMYCYDDSLNDIPSDPLEIRERIMDFVRSNVVQGRCIRIATALRAEMEHHLALLEAKRANFDVALSDHETFCRQLESELYAKRCQFDAAKVAFDNGCENLSFDIAKKAEARVKGLFDGYIEHASDITNNAAASHLQKDFSKDISAISKEIGDEISKGIGHLVESFEQTMTSPPVEFKCDTKAPKLKVLAVPPMFFKCFRFSANLLQIFVPLRNANLLNLAISLAPNVILKGIDWVNKRRVSGQLRDFEQVVADTMQTKSSSLLSEIKKRILEELDSAFTSQEENVRKELQSSVSGNDDIQKLDSRIDGLRTLIGTLNVALN